jgi:hypothetical protein
MLYHPCQLPKVYGRADRQGFLTDLQQFAELVPVAMHEPEK